VPNFLVQQSLGYVDAKGEQARVRTFMSLDTYANGATLLGSWKAALDTLTNALAFSAPGIGGFLTESGEYGTVADYESVTDKAVMTFIDGAGQIHRATIPAPVASMFLADGITVNAADADVVTYVNVVTNTAGHAYFISSRGGLAITRFVGGLRTKKANRRRVSIFTKSGNLDEPAE